MIRQWREWTRAVSIPSRLALGVGFLAIVSCSATYAILSGLTRYTPTRAGLVLLLLINLSLSLILGALIAWRLVRLWAEKKSGRAGARLHVRLVTWFSIIAVVPAILVAVFASVTLNLGMDAMFSARVQNALGSAVNVSQAYVNDHATSIESDAIAIADTMQRDPSLFDVNHKVRAVPFIARLSQLTKDRGLRASYILDSTGVALISTQPPGANDPKPVSAADLAEAEHKVLIDATASDGKVTALIKMQSLNDAYLEVLRMVDPRVLGYYQRHHRIQRGEDQLHLGTVFVQAVIFRHRCPVLAVIAQHARIHHPQHFEIGVVQTLHLDEGGDLAIARRGVDQYLVLRLGQIRRRYRLGIVGTRRLRGNERDPRAVEDVGGTKTAIFCKLRQPRNERDRPDFVVDVEQAGIVLHRVGDVEWRRLRCWSCSLT